MVAFGDHRIQIHPCNGRQSYSRARVEIQERMDGSLAVSYQGKCLAIQPAPAEAPVLRVKRRGRPASQEASVQLPSPLRQEKKGFLRKKRFVRNRVRIIPAASHGRKNYLGKRNLLLTFSQNT